MGNWVRGNVKFISKNEESIERLVNAIKIAKDKRVTIGDIPDYGFNMHSLKILNLSDGYYGIMFWVEYHKWTNDKCIKLISDEYDVVSYLTLCTEGGFDIQYELYYNKIRQYSSSIDNTFWMGNPSEEARKAHTAIWNSIDKFSCENTESMVSRFLIGEYITASECKLITYNDVQQLTEDGLVFILKEDDIDKKIGRCLENDIYEMCSHICLDRSECESLYDIINDLKYCI
jgi:hypothetical protein